MNKLLYSVFVFLLILCVVMAVLNQNWHQENSTLEVYIIGRFAYNQQPDNNTHYVFLFFTFFIAFSSLIPISLYVALEIVKIAQKFFIKYDNEIYDYEIDKHAACRATDLIEELGQVEFIFSDKTGFSKVLCKW